MKNEVKTFQFIKFRIFQVIKGSSQFSLRTKVRWEEQSEFCLSLQCKQNSMAQMLEPVTITPKALEEVKNIMATKSIPEGYGLRIGVKGGSGCGGLGYILGFDKEKEGDMTYNVEGVIVHVEKRQTMYLLGLEVDFYEGADARGFTFVNPSA
jgi:iron-sulfur cluster assembly protein